MATNPPLICPETIVTLAGTVMLGLSLERATVEPLAGAALVNVTVQLEVPGAFTVPGVHVRLPGWIATVRAIVADWLIPFRDAVTVTL